MSVILVLIVLSLFVASLFMIFFIWAIKTGQFDDMHTPSVRMLWDEKTPGHNIQVNETRHDDINL